MSEKPVPYADDEWIEHVADVCVQRKDYSMNAVERAAGKSLSRNLIERIQKVAQEKMRRLLG